MKSIARIVIDPKKRGEKVCPCKALLGLPFAPIGMKCSLCGEVTLPQTRKVEKK